MPEIYKTIKITRVFVFLKLKQSIESTLTIKHFTTIYFIWIICKNKNKKDISCPPLITEWPRWRNDSGLENATLKANWTYFASILHIYSSIYPSMNSSTHLYIYNVFVLYQFKTGIKIHAYTKNKRICLVLLDRIIELSVPVDNQQEKPAAFKDRKSVLFNSIYSKGENS